MKRAASVLLAGLVAVLLCVPALAAGSAQLVRTFVTGNTLYTYVVIDETEQPITQAEAKIGTQSFPAFGKLETVQQAGFPVSYLLLVDNSTSMPKYRDSLVAFAQQLAQNGGEHTTFLLATFGEEFSVVNENVSADLLEQEMTAIPFDEQATRLHSCIAQALDYFESLPRQANELRCMVVLSDAVVEYEQEGSITYEELLAQLSTSDVMLHSVGVGQQEDAISALGELASASGGTHQRVADEEQAQEAAEALSKVNGSMLVTGFDLTGCSAAGENQAVSVTFASNGTLVCRAESTVSLPEAESKPETPDVSQPLPPAGNQASPSSSGSGNGEETSTSLPLLPFVAVVVVLGIAGGAAVLYFRKRKPVPPAPQAPEGIFLRIEDLTGCLVGTEPEQYLTGQLIVGRDPSCDIVLDDPSVSRRHARVFLAEDSVYLEDLGSQNGTMVNGASIHMPCQLRSGDELAAGEARWRLKF